MSENITVLVTGASGTLGSAAVPRLEKQGYAVRPMTRSSRAGWVTADLRTGEGLADAVRGVDVIVHLASSPGRPGRTDVAGTRLLLSAAKEAGVKHVLYLSIIGIDRVPYRYYRAKLATEEVVKASGIPYTILRAAQFHDFVAIILSAAGKLGPVIIDPSWRLQPVAIEDVANRIAELIGRPAPDIPRPAPEIARPVPGIVRPGTGETVEYAGPEVFTLDDLARTWLAARGRDRIWRLRLPGGLARAFREGATTTTATPTGSRTWRDYLAAKY